MMPTVRFKACARCHRGDQDLRCDAFGAYWRCLQCGHSVGTRVSQPAPHAKGMQGNFHAFRYMGDAVVFAGQVLYGRLVPRVPGATWERFEFKCPFVECGAMMGTRFRMGRAATRRTRSGAVPYFCPDQHYIHVDAAAGIWA